MRFVPKNSRDLWHEEGRDGGREKLSLAKLVSIWTCVVLSMAFMKNAAKFDLEWMDYIGYAVGMAMSVSPALMNKWLGLKFGGTTNGSANPPAGGSER